MNPAAEPSPAATAPDAPAGGGAALAAIARMRRRIRVVRAARGAIEFALFGAAYAVLVLLLAKTGMLPDRVARRLLWAAALFPLVGAAASAARRVPDLLAAQLLDRAYKLADRLANALEFGAVPAAQRTPMMTAALEDAAERAAAMKLEPRRALAWRWPAETAYAGALVALLGLVSLVEFRTRVLVTHRAPAAAARDPLVLTDDDLEAFRDFAREMEQRATTEQSREALERFNRFIDEIGNEALDRQEAFRRLQALQDELEQGRENDREALREALREMGNRMDQSETSRQLAEALRQADPRAAAQAMQQLAEQLRQNRLNEQQRQELARALQRAQEQRQDDLQQRLQRAREETERMLRQQRERQLSQSEQRNLQQRQRQLEQLNRENQRRENQRRQLSQLNRSMSQAMQDLMRDMAQAAQDMEQGAADLNRMHDQQLSEQQMAELRQQLEDLRQRMRQQNGQNGEQQRRQLQRFAGRARGGVMPGGFSGGRLRLMRGQGGGGGGGMPMPGGQGQQGQNGGQQGNEPGQGAQAGTGHDAHMRGAATSLRANMRTVAVAGQQSGQGPVRSQVIRSAAQDGFTVQGYRQVHAEYWEHAREVVHAGDVPPGYRSYVRRYFQLIRPRE